MKRKHTAITLLLVILCGCSLDPQQGAGIPAALDPDLDPALRAVSEPFAIVYEHSEYNGHSKVIYWGNYHSNLSKTRWDNSVNLNMNDKISSVKLYNGMALWAYQHKERGGRVVHITENIRNMKSINFNDSISSIDSYNAIRNLKARNIPLVMLFSEKNYQGSCLTLYFNYGAGIPEHTMEEYATLTAASMVIGWEEREMNDQASSVRCYNGARVDLFENTGLKGMTLSTADNIADLSAYGFDNIASSARLALDAKPGGAVEFFRYYHPTGYDHFYTTNWNELGYGGTQTKYYWEYKGFDCYVFTSQVPGTIPLHEFWYADGCDHLLIADRAAVDGSPYWKYSGVRAFIFANWQNGTVPLYGFWNPSTCDHGISTNFCDFNPADGWSCFGLLGYVYPATSLRWTP
jgi:hypothetical protein